MAKTSMIARETKRTKKSFHVIQARFVSVSVVVSPDVLTASTVNLVYAVTSFAKQRCVVTCLD